MVKVRCEEIEIVESQALARGEVQLDYLTIDRFEGDSAICEKEDSTLVEVPLAELPDTVKEGTMIVYDGISYVACSGRGGHSKKRRKTIRELMKSLFAD